MALAFVGAVLATATVQPVAAKSNTPTKNLKAQVVSLKQGIAFHRGATWHWQALALRKPTKSAYAERRISSVGYLRWMTRLWSQRRIVAKRYAMNPPRRTQWLCIHRYERNPKQGWSTDTGNGYYGGLQMDIAFQRTYGSELLKAKGTADHWSPIEQMWVAERAYRSGRGFYPWPNTARYCGLI